MTTAAVHVYVSQRPSRFLTLAHEEKLIVLQTAFMPNEGIRVARDKLCACHDKLVLCHRTITVCRGTHIINEYPYYHVPIDATPDEELTLVTWLTRERFFSFGHDNINGTMKRVLVPNAIFQSKPHPTCQYCEQHCMIKEPVFCLKSIVLSMKNKGPTVESVLT
jgi:hypothetical protein